MKDVTKLTADELLKISQPELIFVNDGDETKKLHRKLRSIWYNRTGEGSVRDTCISDHVFHHINQLYEQALNKIADGSWETPGVLQFRLDGKKYELKYHTKRPFELGDIYLSRTLLTFMVPLANKDLVENLLNRVKSFKFADGKMKDEMMKFLPEVVHSGETLTHAVIIVKKPEDLICLRDALSYLGGRIDGRHVAWILSAIYNITCYLKYTKLVHNDISLDSVYISPEKHSAVLLGGWWYAAQSQEKLVALPTRTLNLAPPDLLTKKLGDERVDLALVRGVGRELLGDPTGVRLLHDATVPSPIAAWLQGGGGSDAFKEYSSWQSVLQSSYGKRKFVELALSAKDVYHE